MSIVVLRKIFLGWSQMAGFSVGPHLLRSSMVMLADTLQETVIGSWASRSKLK
jgi:hypothetical protein